MKRTTVELLACPVCHGSLVYDGPESGLLLAGRLICRGCRREYPLEGGIPLFIQPEALTGLNRRLSRVYDWASWFYRLFSKIAFWYIGMDEETGRREVTDRLEPRGGRVLEVSIGPGVNLPYLVGRPDVGGVFGLDISHGQLRRCRSYASRKGWDVELFLGNAEQLPFEDETFDGLFHVGGINFFNDKQAAIHEMIRVSRPGARILIADETEKGAQAYEKFIPDFKKSIGDRRETIVAPVELVPAEMLERRVFEVWKGWMYCIEFRKPWIGRPA